MLNKYLSTLSYNEKISFIFRILLEIDNEEEIQKFINQVSGDAFIWRDIKSIYLKTSLLRKYRNKFIESKEEYSDKEEYYNSILKKFSKLARELNLNNSLEVSNLYTYLLWNGYFSVTGKNEYSIKDRILKEGIFSYNIMEGNGVCLDQSELLKDFLIKCGYNASTIINYSEKENKYEKFKFVSRNCNKEKVKFNLLNQIIENIIGNHAFTLIEEKDKLYIYDPTNISISKLEDKNNSSIITGKGSSILKTNLSYLLNITSKSTIALDCLNYTKDFSSPYSKQDFSNCVKDCLENFEDNKKIIEDARDDAYNDIKEISIFVKKIKRYKEL